MKQNRRITVLALGDSLTAGWGLPEGISLPAILQDRLRAAHYNVRFINAGIPGDTSGGGLSRLPMALEINPQAVVVQLGTNDGLMGLPPQDLEHNLDAMLSLVADKGLPCLLCGSRSLSGGKADYAKDFQAVYFRLAKKYDTFLLPDILDGIVGHQGLTQNDGIHPNEKGTQMMADALYPLVRELVEQALL